MSKLIPQIKIIAASALAVAWTTGTLALPAQNPVGPGGIPSGNPAWTGMCMTQCEQMLHVAPSAAAAWNPKVQACLFRCEQMRFQTMSGGYSGVVPPPQPPGGISNCDLSAAGNAAWFAFCKVDSAVLGGALWGVITNGLAALLGNSALANTLVGAAKNVADPCQYVYNQLQNNQQALCPN